MLFSTQLFRLHFMSKGILSEDRVMMLNPSRFRTDAIALEPIDSSDAILNAERARMGIDLD
jgi:hypothetical protein